MDWTPGSVIRWLFDSKSGQTDRFLARWIFLRALGAIYFSAFFSLAFQIRGLIGPEGILPAGEYLHALAETYGRTAYWYAPSLLWFSSGSHAVTAVCWAGMIASVVLIVNFWPRAMLVICFVCFLSFVAAAGEFSSYQSDGMLLEAGFVSFFVAPRGLRPGLASDRPPVRAALYLLLWEWFRIYFESGVAKYAGGDPGWRNFTAMEGYYQNGPLPTWIGWYAHQLPSWFHVGTAAFVLGLELVLIWGALLPRRFRIILFFICTFVQIGIILTANYAFLNYIVLFLGFLLLDDRFLEKFFPRRWTNELLTSRKVVETGEFEERPIVTDELSILPTSSTEESSPSVTEDERSRGKNWQKVPQWLAPVPIAISAVFLTWICYATIAELIWMVTPAPFLPTTPVTLLEPFRIANQYGLFGRMTHGRYEVEFQGSNDGQAWAAYPFRHKPQDPAKPPGIYAPYQPRFDWNLWFASLGEWRGSPFVARTEVRLLSNDQDVLSLFAGNPFPKGPPRQVRAVLWQYWFTSKQERRATGMWWRREWLGLYAPALEKEADGRIAVREWPQPMPEHD